MPECRESTEVTSARPPWKASTTAYTSIRLHVDSSSASVTFSWPSSSSSSLAMPSEDTASRSSVRTSAVRWDTPTASRLIPTTPHVERSTRPSSSPGHHHSALVRVRRLVGASRHVERQDLHLHRQVDLAHLDVVGNLEHDGCEVQDALHARGYQTVADPLRGGWRRGDHPYRHLPLGAHPGDVVDVADQDSSDRHADQVLVHVEQRRHRETPAGEARVVGQGVTKVTDPDHADGVLPGESEDSLDLADEDFHLVSDAARAVRADVGQVLAQLGRVDPGGGGQLLAGDGRHVLLGQPRQHPQVDREAGDGGLGNGPGPLAHGPLLATGKPARGGHDLDVLTPP